MIEPGRAHDRKDLALGDRITAESVGDASMIEAKPVLAGGELFRADRGPQGRWFVWQRLGAGWSALRGCRDQREAHRLASEMNHASSFADGQLPGDRRTLDDKDARTA
ncbi:MAG: hypothetical protein AAF356_01130 [Planctomycetota bacterium]